MFISVVKSKTLRTVAIALFLLLTSHSISDGADHIVPSWESMDDYYWTYGCTPTAAAMVLSYWDNCSFFGRLIDYYYVNSCGNPSDYPSNVPNAIDELLPCLQTDWNTSSCTGSGMTLPTNIKSGIECVTNTIHNYNFTVSTCSDVTPGFVNDWCWDEMKAEIDAGRPFVWSMSGLTDAHSNAAWGYRDDKYIILYDTGQDGRHDWYYANYLGTEFLAAAQIDRLSPGGWDDSDIKLDDPIGGEFLLANNPYTIYWYQWGTSINYVDLYYSEDEGVSWTFIGGRNSVEGWNSYTWLVPNISPTTARVRVLGFNGSTYISGDGSFGNFTVAMPFCYDLIYPMDEWYRVWYTHNGSYCIGNSPNESLQNFDNDWGTGVVAYGRSDDIEFRSGRAIFLPNSGDYRISVGSDDGVRLWIDDVLMIDSWFVRGYTIDRIDVSLSWGFHYFRLDYFENSGNARVSFKIEQVPDLVVQSITITPTSPIAGQSVSVTVTVKNQGPVDAGNFAVDIYKDRATAPVVGVFGDVWCPLSGLAAGATATCTQSVTYASEGNYNMWAQVDSEGQVLELSESNNVFGPKSIVVTPVLSVTPSGGFFSSGSQGGPFSPSEKTYTLKNNSGSTINWTAAERPGWWWLIPTSGTLGAGTSTTVRVLITSQANSLAPGSYNDTVTFTNTTNGSGNTTRPISLTVNALPGVLSVITTPISGDIYVNSIYKGTGSWSGAVSMGSHIVSFGSVSAYGTPSPQTVMVYGGQTTSVTGTYVTPTYIDTVQKIYIGYYQRPADPGGLIYWANRLFNSGGNLSEIIEAFANSPESQALYGTINSSNISSVVNGIYNALFGRDAEIGGLNWYVNGFNSGQYTPATIMLNVLYGAQNEDLQSINNKLTAANIFTWTIDPELDGANFQATYAGDMDAQKARNFLSTVGWEAATIPTQAEATLFIKNDIADPGDPILNP